MRSESEPRSATWGPAAFRLGLAVRALGLWMLAFVLARVAFVAYHQSFTRELSASDILWVFLRGARMDLSICGYILAVPTLVLIFGSFSDGRLAARLVDAYTAVLLCLVSLLVFVDLELYRHWGFRLDAGFLSYIASPREVLGSANLGLAIPLLTLWALLAWLAYRVHRRLVGVLLARPARGGATQALTFSGALALLVVAMRGGVGEFPMNLGSVYFHKTSLFANHATLNVVWSLGYALTEQDRLAPYNYFDRTQAEGTFAAALAHRSESERVLAMDRPNVIVLIMESLTNKIVEPLGGARGITPTLTQLAPEGLLFSNCFANGNRTEKGVISVLNGYPGHPKTAVILYPGKLQKIPYLSRDLAAEGYDTGFVYGYDLDYAGFRAYLLMSGYRTLVHKEDFPTSERNSKWGVHDHYVLDRLFQEAGKMREPFFLTFVAQSAHEPFDVPMETVVPGDDEEHQFLNSAYYADRALGDFIRKAKGEDWWRRTLVVIIADHGGRHPGNTPYTEPARYRVPMLWLGGALSKRSTVVDTYCSQSDVAYSLLRQLRIEPQGYRFSQDIFAPGPSPFGFYVFNDGFGLFERSGSVIFDNVGRRPLALLGSPGEGRTRRGQAFMQVLSTDLAEQ